MLPVTKAHTLASAAPPASRVDTVSSDLDSPANMTFCRVCLAMDVKLSHMTEYKLTDKFERVTGVKITENDKLPKNLCWECVARLRSANNFIVKALKTQRIMMDKCRGGRLITVKDIKSLDRCDNQLESTLGPKFYEVNNCNLHILEDAADNETILESVQINIKEDIEDTKLIEPKTEFDIDICDEEQLYNAKDDISYGRPIKTELFDINEVYVKCEVEDTDMGNREIMVKQEYASDEEIADFIESKGGKNSLIQLRNQTATTPRCKELTVVGDLCMSKYNKQISPSVFKMPSKNAEKCKNYRNRKKAATLKIKKTSLTSAERSRMYRLRKKQLTQGIESSVNEVLYSPSTSNSPMTFEPSPQPVTTDHSTIKNEYYSSIQENSKEENTIMEILPNSISDPGTTSQTVCTNTSMGHTNSSLALYGTKSLDKLFICDKCNKSFQHKYSLIRHILKPQKRYNCTYCGYKTHLKIYLKAHINAKHTRTTEFNCLHCSYKTYDKSSLYKHNTIHTKTTFNCSHCDFKTYQEELLNKHVNAKHTKNSSYDCSYCTYKTHLKGDLNKHVNAKHTKSISYDCSHCSFKTFQRGYLNKHINAKHTKNTSYDCLYCSYKAHHSGDLSKHVNSKHTKRISYDCSYCSYKAYIKEVLLKHINAKHTKSVTFNCSLCSYTTYQKQNLHKHVKSKHK